jgi:hypothetical protein
VNSPTGKGGGIYLGRGKVIFNGTNGTTIKNNTAFSGNGLYRVEFFAFKVLDPDPNHTNPVTFVNNQEVVGP